MLANVRLRFDGIYWASAFDDRTAAEWPPHPARFFYSMVDAWAGDGRPAAGRDALLWIE